MSIYGLIGKTLDHSFSQKYFNSLFAVENSAERFELFPLPEIGHLPSLIRSQQDLRGLAVTIPYKQTVLPFLHRLDETAQLTGAVNCISIGDEWVGYNTDVVGFEKSFVPLLQPHHQKALVLGTGGASRAVQFVLRKMGMPFFVLSRSASKGIAYEQLTHEAAREHTAWIQCTPLGTWPEVNLKPDMPYSEITSGHLLYDLVYNPQETAFLKEGLMRGAKVKNGLEMLEIQAMENLRIWRSSL